MRDRTIVLITAAFTALTIAACSHDPSGLKARKPDPFITIRVRNQLDTTSFVGRAHWHIFAILTGPQGNKNGVSNQGAMSLQDTRLGLVNRCVSVGADSIGQRLVMIVAFGDTTSSSLTADSTALRMANHWFAGDTVLMTAGWRSLHNAASDAWDSQQYLDGHGRTRDDPIKWGLDWTGAGSVSFYERSDTSALCGQA